MGAGWQLTRVACRRRGSQHSMHVDGDDLISATARSHSASARMLHRTCPRLCIVYHLAVATLTLMLNLTLAPVEMESTEAGE